MLPICLSNPSSCSSQSQIFFGYGSRPLTYFGKDINIRYILKGRGFLGVPGAISAREVSLKTQATKFIYTSVVEGPEVSGSSDITNSSSYLNELNNLEPEFSNNLNDSVGADVGSIPLGSGGELNFAEDASMSTLTDQLSYDTNELSKSAASQPTVPWDDAMGVSENPLVMVDDAITKLKSTIEEFVSSVNASINASVGKGESALQSTLDSISASLTDTTKSINEAIGSSVNKAEKVAGSGATGFSGDFKEATGNASTVAFNVLRKTIVGAEDLLAGGTSYAVYSYSYAKELLPPEARNVLNETETKAVGFLTPVKTALKQVYFGIEGLVAYLGLDPNDQIIPFVLLLGTSATLGITYRILTYGGYSGDLSPNSTLELLTREDDVVLIDASREKDGVPDLRRGARFRYASVTLPEIDGSVRKLVVRGKDLDDDLTAAVIRNLKIVRDRSKVIVMDADGTRSKSIARSLKKLGVKRPYLLHGGFRSWVKNGLRIKQLRPETTLTILNEEAEAILEEIKPTPLKTFSYAAGTAAAIYALSGEHQWEKTLQLIGVVAIAKTIYSRVSSYENSEDFRQDLRLLLVPVTLGTDAFSWAAKKLEPSRVGLPTSPSSSAVQDRVLQAAAKHESQPSDSDEMQDVSRESVAPVDENVDLSEA
ncbi:hypothetical protein C5167_043137 [Papaver somniferum]|uniref:Rhodanese domain-containing protein n=1 Tax=Papaver somniferum TaxID=3469 RepID=A0A4Y7L8I0_PAPSO|nr:hypothetical protein C5167_043137 [Papaver somniferum]